VHSGLMRGRSVHACDDADARPLLGRAVRDAYELGAAALERHFGQAQFADAVVSRTRALATGRSIDECIRRVSARADIDRAERTESHQRQEQTATPHAIRPADECCASATPRRPEAIGRSAEARCRTAEAGSWTAVARRNDADRTTGRHRTTIARSDDTCRPAGHPRRTEGRVDHTNWPARAGTTESGRRPTPAGSRARRRYRAAPRRADPRVVL